MWTRAFLKDNAKEFLKKYTKTSIIICLIFYLLVSMFSINSINIKESQEFPFINSSNMITVNINGLFQNINVNNILNNDDIINKYIFAINPLNLNYGQPFYNYLSMNFEINEATYLNLSILFFVISIFLIKPLSIGLKRYFINGYKNDSKLSYLFSAFTDGSWFKLALKLTLKDIYLLLWSLLLIIPGIIKSYQYYYVDYILAENPDMSLSEAINISKRRTEGEKFDIFELNLSFIGWIILASLTLNIGYIILNPYMEATYASLYIFNKLKDEGRLENDKDSIKGEVYI